MVYRISKSVYSSNENSQNIHEYSILVSLQGLSSCGEASTTERSCRKEQTLIYFLEVISHAIILQTNNSLPGSHELSN